TLCGHAAPRRDAAPPPGRAAGRLGRRRHRRGARRPRRRLRVRAPVAARRRQPPAPLPPSPRRVAHAGDRGPAPKIARVADGDEELTTAPVDPTSADVPEQVDRVLTVPNAISVVRLLCIPLFL